jgi:catechol 2,3-dioxygenase
MDTIPTLHHVTLKTTRLKEMIDWYDAVVGLKPQYVAPVGAWLTNDAANHRLALLAFPGISDDVDKDSHTGIHHMAFEFSSLDELFENFARLRTLRIAPSLCLDHGITISMYYADPDRNVVELQVDNFHDWAKSSEYMRTAREFAANPLGVLFDPGRAYDAFKAGETHEELHRAMMGGHLMPDAPPPLIGLPPGASLGPPQADGSSSALAGQ